MTSLLISDCQVALISKVITPSATYDSDRPVDNLFQGGRSIYAQLATAAGSVTIDFALGGSTTATVDHFVMGGDSKLIADGLSAAKLSWATTPAGPWTDFAGVTSGYNSRTVLNSNNGDKLFTASLNDAIGGLPVTKGNFRFTMSKTSGTSKFPLAKLYFGSFFDMAKEPAFDYPLDEEDSGSYRSPIGKVVFGRTGHPNYRFELTWQNVSDAKVIEFTTRFLEDPLRRYVYLYSSTYLDVLNGQKLVFCEILQEEAFVRKVAYNLNVVSVVFREIR